MCPEVSLLCSVVAPRGLLSASLHFWVPRGERGRGGEGGRVEWGGSGSEVSGSFTFVFSCPAAGSTLGFFAFLGTPRGERERVAEWSEVAQGVRCLEVSLLCSVPC